MGTIGSNVLYGRPDDYVFKRKAEIEAMTPAQVAVAAKALDPDALTWVVVGDLKQDRAGARAEPGRGHHPRRRRQAGGEEVSRFVQQ
jgi:zinc protease